MPPSLCCWRQAVPNSASAAGQPSQAVGAQHGATSTSRQAVQPASTSTSTSTSTQQHHQHQHRQVSVDQAPCVDWLTSSPWLAAIHHHRFLSIFAVQMGGPPSESLVGFALHG
ncbi:hypothetical protein O9K51_06103 [Purpureocillium lavendulum]|uniref:Uncharacterized protein n=1 Tax=Purpureocillium lavendulum TaxID=1247861 RepID=A0AB34FN19_9HYPO|nr:hypothetical protein O9K51_06103 [Purpureocillium lavendulum]